MHRRSGRQDFHDKIRRTPHLPVDDRQAFRSDKQDVRLHDQRALFVENHVERRNADHTQSGALGVVGEQPQDFDHDLLMREERRRRLAHDAVRELSRPIGLVRREVLLRRHDDDDAIV